MAIGCMYIWLLLLLGLLPLKIFAKAYVPLVHLEQLQLDSSRGNFSVNLDKCSKKSTNEAKKIIMGGTTDCLSSYQWNDKHSSGI